MIIVGSHVKWRHFKEDGSGALATDFAGVVVAVSWASSSIGWSALVLQDDGTLAHANVENLVVTDGILEAVTATPEEQATAASALATLGAYLEREFGPAPSDLGVGEYALELLGQFKEELVAVGADRDKHRADVQRLEAFVAEMKNKQKKPKGAAGPGEG